MNTPPDAPIQQGQRRIDGGSQSYSALAIEGENSIIRYILHDSVLALEIKMILIKLKNRNGFVTILHRPSQLNNRNQRDEPKIFIGK